MSLEKLQKPYEELVCGITRLNNAKRIVTSTRERMQALGEELRQAEEFETRCARELQTLERDLLDVAYDDAESRGLALT